MPFLHKVIIVTGATSGIGRATALALGRERASVVAVGRRQDALADLTPQVESAGGRCHGVEVDVTEAGAPERIVRETLDAFRGIDGLVNAAGIIASGTIESTTDQAWDLMLDINVRAPFRLMRQALPHLVARRGTVVNVSSVTGLRSFPGILAYSVSKSGMDQLTRCAALELAPKGVRVNAVNPGVTITNLHRRSGMSEEQYGSFLEHSRSTHPLGRPGEPAEVAELILFLLSERSGWMTGETVAIDGGRHLTCAR